MKFYYAPGTCSLATHIALLEAGLKFEAIKVDLRSKKAGSENYLDINPKGYVPALVLDTQQVMTECVAILQWAADQATQKNLLPQWGTPGRYKAIEWLNYIATELHRGFSPLWQPTTTQEQKQKIKESLVKRFTYVEQQLVQNEFLLGQQFTVVDGYLFVMLEWAQLQELDLKAFPKLVALHSRVKSRPTTQEAQRLEK